MKCAKIVYSSWNLDSSSMIIFVLDLHHNHRFPIWCSIWQQHCYFYKVDFRFQNEIILMMDESQVQGKNNYISIINPQWNIKFYVIFSMFCNSSFLMLPNTLNFVYVIPYYCCCLFWYVYVYAFLFQINKRHEISPVLKRLPCIMT